jgi:NADH-quinone oxidoreductase subunit C
LSSEGSGERGEASLASEARDQAPEAPETEAPEVDHVRQGMVEALGDVVLESVVVGGDVTVRVANERWHEAVAACRSKLDMDYFCFLSAIDWLNNPALAGEKVWGELPEEEGDEAGEVAEEAPVATVETGVAGGDTRFQVFARLYSTTKKIGITLKADLDEANPTVHSITDLYRGADWHEREAWDLMGIRFEGHPNLVRILLEDDWEGHPLRKDYPIGGEPVRFSSEE